jgi:LysM domain
MLKNDTGLVERTSAPNGYLASALRRVTDRLTFPLARRAVAAALVMQVVARPATLSFASPLPESAIVLNSGAASSSTDPYAMFGSPVMVSADRAPIEQPHAHIHARHVVQLGGTLWSISERYYGSGDEFDRLIEANLGKRMDDGRIFERAGLIYPGWSLDVPLMIDEENGARWYTVRRGDTLRGIAGRLFGDEGRYLDLFELNVGSARVSDHGPVLRQPDLIWPGLRLRLPTDVQSDQVDVQVAPGEGAGTAPHVGAEDTVSDEATRVLPPTSAGSGTLQPTLAIQPDTPTPAVDLVLFEPPDAAAESTSAARHSAATEATPHNGAWQTPPLAAVAGGGALAAAIAAGALVVRRRRPAPPLQVESNVVVGDGFAAADPVEGLARRLARTVDPAAAVAGLLARAYAEVFAEQLADEQRQEALAGLELVATRHGQSSTTVTIAAPVPARPHLIRHMQAAVARAFGEHADTDGLVSRDGDVLVRVTWHPRHPVPAHVLDRLNSEHESSAWPAPCLVPFVVLYDRQPFSVNWHSLTNILVAAPLGDGADTILTGLVAALASGRAPDELGLVIMARPGALPQELGKLPHLLIDSVDPMDPASVSSALDAVQEEVGRRAADAGRNNPEVILVIGELAELDPAAGARLSAIAVSGHQSGGVFLPRATGLRPNSSRHARSSRTSAPVSCEQRLTKMRALLSWERRAPRNSRLAVMSSFGLRVVHQSRDGPIVFQPSIYRASCA